MTIDNLLPLVTQYFNEQHHYEPLKLELIITPTLYDKRLELAVDDNDRAEVIKSRSFIETLNGTVVLPKSFDTPPTVLLNEGIIREDLAFLETIAHEITHLYDYRDLARHIGASTYNELRNYEYQGAFYYWTEFHARRNGYQFYGNLVWKDEFNSQERLSHIQGREAQFQMKHLIEMLGQYTNDAVQYMYSFMQYMGRYSVWQDLFPGQFTELPINLRHEYNGLLTKIYRHLCNWNEFAIVKDHFGELHELFNSLG